MTDTILVTGGTRGIGRAIVDALIGGALGERSVAFTWQSQQSVADEIVAQSSGRAKAFRFDLMDRSRPDELISEVEAELGPLVGLVNNAGLRREGLLALTGDAEWDELVEANLGGVFRCCRAVMRGMVVRRRGSIVNLGSLAAIHGVPGEAVYGAAKAGVVGLTRSLAREVGSRGVRVNAVLPGFVPTDMTAGVPPAAVAALRAQECLPAGVSAASVAATVCFLLSEGAASITGQALVVDAGVSA
jgi:3-oxoacyl-[acyl-carrier protein] reductase